MSRALEYQRVIREITNGSPANGFSNYVVQGRIDKMDLHTYVGLYPRPSSSPYSNGIDHKCLALVGKKLPEPDGLRQHLEVVRQKILKLELSQRVVNLQKPEMPELTAEVNLGFSLLEIMPVALIGVGETVKGDIEDVMVMWHIAGLSSQSALNIFKAKLQANLSALN